MANDKLGNLLKFTEYDHLQPKQKPTSRTEIGGFAVLEGLSIKELMKLAAKKTGMDKKELEKLSPKKLKKLIGYKKEKKVEVEEKDDDKKDEEKEEKVEKKDESYLFEKKAASAKQKAARAKFMEMIQSKKKGKTEDKGDDKPEPKKGFPFKKK